MENKIHYGLPMKDYLENEYFGSSNLKILNNETPKDFLYHSKVPFEDTKATIIGTAIHTKILEPHLFDEQYALQPEDWGPLNRNPGSAKWREFKKENSDKICLSWEDSKTINKALVEARDSSTLQAILLDGKVEVTGFYDEGSFGLKARSDIHEKLSTDDSCMLWDIKTTSKPLDTESLTSMVFNYGYHFQAAHHMHVFRKLGMVISGFGWIFISTAPGSSHVVCRPASVELLEKGNQQFNAARERLELCYNEDMWPGREVDDFEEIKLPRWVRGSC